MKKAIGLLLFVLMVICTACAPKVTITEPQDGATFDEGATIVFKCEATDRMDGELSGESVVWYADNEDNILGTGTAIETDAISSGEHTVMVKATNSKGKVGSDEITITIGEGGPSTTTTSVTAPSTATIGQSGGTIAVGKAHLEIPPGALESNTQVSISEVTGDESLVGLAYLLEPNGLQFTKPAALTIDYAKENLPKGYEPDEVAIVSLDEYYDPPAQDDPNDPLAPLLNIMPYYVETTVNQANTSASAQISHFSRYAIKPVLTWTAGTDKWIVKPDEQLDSNYFDVGNADKLASSVNNASCEGIATYLLLQPSIWLEVHTECLNAAGCGGNMYAQVMIAKYFLVKADPSTDVVPRTVVGCNIIDTGETHTGTCNRGERRVRVIDLGSGETYGKDAPNTIASEEDEWNEIPMPESGIMPTEHTSTGLAGKTYILEPSLKVGHYYAVVVDLWAASMVSSAIDPVSGLRYNPCGDTCSQEWDYDQNKFEVDALMITSGSVRNQQ
jgi:hypothetical protein